MKAMSIYSVTLPKWGLEMSEGAVVAWHVAEGDAVQPGVPLCDIETEKIVNTLEAEHPGVLRRRIAGVGEMLPVGALIAVLALGEAEESDVAAFVTGFKSRALAGEPEPPPPVLDADALRLRNEAVHASPIARRLANGLLIDLSTVTGSGKGGRISQEDVERISPSRVEAAAPAPAPAALAGPAARKLAAERGIDLDDVAPTGVKGRVSKDDVRAAPGPASPPEDDSTFTPFTGLRRTIGQALARAKQTIPHIYLTADVVVDDLLTLRRDLDRRARAHAKPSLNDFLLKAAAAALLEVPDVNVHVTDDGVRRFARANIAIAVAIDGGLITPVLRDVGAKTVETVAHEAAALVERARDRKLAQSEITGGTFTVTNLGMFGVQQFDAIVNPPQGAILAVGGLRREAFEGPGGVVEFHSVMTVTLSCDHRAIDGATGARFLAAFKQAMAEPLGLLF